MDILITCPPMLGMASHFTPRFDALGWTVVTPPVVQTLSESELIERLPRFAGWIAGDDPVTRPVLAAGKVGRLRAVVKWGVGVDNVDFAAARDLGFDVRHTPGMFGDEVADVAMAYVTGLARDLFWLDRQVRAGGWPKPRGISLAGKTVALVGFGDIGRAVARRLLAAEMQVVAYDPAWTNAGFAAGAELAAVRPGVWPEGLESADFVVLCCALTPANHHLIDAAILARSKPGLRLINVARGPLVDERALMGALASGRVAAAALDVFEEEPLPHDSPLRAAERLVYGSHNASNTADAVLRTSERAIDLLVELLPKGEP